MTALQESENWDDDFEFQVETSQATENWDDYFDDSRQSPRKIIQRHREESWDDEDSDDDEIAEEDRTVTRRTHPPRSPTSSVFSLPTTIQTFSSTAHLRPTSAFAFIPPPIHKERERRRLRKKSRPNSQAVVNLVVPTQERPSFSPASDSTSDISIDRNPIQTNNSTFYLWTPNPSRTDLSEDAESSGTRTISFVATRTGNPKLPTWSPTKLVKRKPFGFVHLGRGVGGHGGGENEVVDGRILEKENHPKESARSFMRSVRRISLVSVGVVGRHRKTKSGGGFPTPISPAPTLLPPEISLGIPMTSSDQRCTSSQTADLRRATSLSSPTATSGPVRPCFHHSPPPSLSKRCRRTLSRPESFRDGGPKTRLDFQQERLPFFDPSEGRDITSLRTPTQSTFLPLLPPIELQPPSPTHIQKQPGAHTTDEVVEGLESETLVATPSPSSSLVFFTPSSSFSRDNVSAGAIEDILPLPPVSPEKSPLQSQQSVSLGRSTAIASGDGDGDGGAGGGLLPRRNSLGDLKIPAKISQAQVGLRRDLGMVREFASNVEQLKELQSTYDSLVVEVQGLLDTQRQHVPQPVEKPPLSVPSPDFVTRLESRPKTHASSNTLGSTHDSDSDSQAYQAFVDAFWNIRSKYKVSWECAELLIELGGGSGGGIGDAPPMSVSAPVVQRYLAGSGGEGEMFDSKGKLTGEESKHSTTPPPLSSTAQTHDQSQPSENATGSPPLASPPSMSWRASTGRNDFSQRQLVLLRDMLNNNGGASVADDEGELCPPPHLSILVEDPELHPSSRSEIMNLNRARDSTITLSEEQGSGIAVEEGGRRDGKMEKRRRSGMLGMSGIRDMLRSFRKESQQQGNLKSGEVESGQRDGRLPALAHPSTTSLSTESSIGRQQQSRIPIRRRPRSSTGPEFRPSPTSFPVPKPSPRRPNLASIFRIGNNKTKPVRVLPTSVEDPCASEHDLSAAQCSSGTTCTGGGDGDSTGEEEEDWDRMDSASDLDAVAAKGDEAYDVSATVRGRDGVKTKGDERKKAGVSSDQPSRENDPPLLPSPPASSSSSSSTGLGKFLARHSIIPNLSFSASQSSILSSGGGDGQGYPLDVVPCRLSRHSDFEERQCVEPRISSPKSAPPSAGSPSPLRSTNVIESGSMPSSLLPQAQQQQHLFSSLPPDRKVGMVMTAENIKPLLENAKEVYVRLYECIGEIRALVEDGAGASRPDFLSS